MHAFHRHLLSQVTEALHRGVCVVVDPAGAFRPFFEALGASPTVEGRPVHLATFDGSWFGLRAEVEPHFRGDGLPDPAILVYVPAPLPPAAQDVLLEIERAGRRLDWELDREARECLRQRFTDGVIDEVLKGGRASYEDVVAFLDERSPASKLKAIFKDASDLDIVVQWLASDAHDAAIAEKSAQSELQKLTAAKLGAEWPEKLPLGQARARVARYVLVSEFRHDLDGEPPASVAKIETPVTDAHRETVLRVAQTFRERFADAYVLRADQVQEEFHLARASIRADRLGRIDTFRFEEQALLAWCAELLERRQYAEALAIVVEREQSFWIERREDHGAPRKEAWELCRRVGELGRLVQAVAGDLPGSAVGPEVWVARYVANDGWHRVDAAQRALETWRTRIDDESVCEKAVGTVLRDHETLSQGLATAFSKALSGAGWSVPGALGHTRIHPDVVAKLGGPVAWFWVDALRFEMGAELARRLEGATELRLQPAIAALPSITPVGMAALLPGASANFAVTAPNGKLAAVVDGVPLADVGDRLKFLKARVPDAVDVTLSRVLQDKPSELKARVAGKSLIVVRSTEIDALGENGEDQLARQAMETVIGNLERAARKLAAAGVASFVVTADHGHLFGLRKGDDMKIDAPGGQTIELHRRCWIGRGGATPAGAVRVTAHALGYDSDLEFVFPTGLGVFKAGGDLSFHHGGTSLQELLVPVLSFRLATSAKATGPSGAEVRLHNVPSRVTNRVFVVDVEVVAQELFTTEPLALRVLLLSENEQVGQAGMASGGEFDRTRSVVLVKPGTTAHVGLSLSREDVVSLKIVVLDPNSGAVLATSPSLPVSLMR